VPLLTALLALSFTASAADEESTDKSAAARKFMAGYLKVAPLRITTVTTNQHGAAVSASSVDIWTVYKGQNTMVRADEFATLAGDAATLEKMKSEKKVGLAVGVPLAVVGFGLVGYGTWAYTDKPMKNFGWLMGGMFGGGLVGVVGVLVATGPGKRQHWPKMYYTEEKATEIVDIYNAEKLKELGLTKEDVQQYFKERADAPSLEVRPYIAGTSVGLTGTF